ncbi:MAG: SRPBCC domain-containing protein, partial [Actinomycetota bacterium]
MGTHGRSPYAPENRCEPVGYAPPMRIENDMHVSASMDEAWALLTDIPAIAPCLPGAKLTGQDGDTYEGQMKIKVGPVVA